MIDSDVSKKSLLVNLRTGLRATPTTAELVYFAAFKNHIGFYATPSGHSEFQDEFSKYKQGKGSVQFPLNQPIPYKLIEKIVKFRVAENNEQFSKALKPKK